MRMVVWHGHRTIGKPNAAGYNQTREREEKDRCDGKSSASLSPMDRRLRLSLNPFEELQNSRVYLGHLKSLSRLRLSKIELRARYFKRTSGLG